MEGYGCYMTRMGGRDLDLSGWGYGQVEQKSEFSGSIKFEEFLDYLRNCYFLSKNYAPLELVTTHFLGARHKFSLILISCSDLTICVIFKEIYIGHAKHQSTLSISLSLELWCCIVPYWTASPRSAGYLRISFIDYVDRHVGLMLSAAGPVLCVGCRHSVMAIRQ